MSRRAETYQEMQERFWRHVEAVDSGCWLWDRPGGAGYGTFSCGNKNYRAHRLSYQWLVRDIPLGYELDHLCRVPACVNPAHLEAVSHRENCRRGISTVGRNSRKATCERGHPLDGQFSSWKGRRLCLTCKRIFATGSQRRRVVIEAAKAWCADPSDENAERIRRAVRNLPAAVDALIAEEGKCA